MEKYEVPISELDWVDSYGAIYSAEEIICQRRNDWKLEEKILVDHVMVELKFLYTFVGCAYIWRSKKAPSASTSASSPNYHEVIVVEVADEAKKLIVYLKTNFIDRFFYDDPYHPPQFPRPQDFKSSWFWVRTSADPVPVLVPVPVPVPFPSLGDVFTHLNQLISRLKSRIIRVTASIDDLHPRPPYSFTKTHAWYCFCECVKCNLQYLSHPKSALGDSLRKQMEASHESLISVDWLLTGLHCSSPWHRRKWDRGSCPLWEDATMARFGGVVIKVAHVCCFCYYAPVNQFMKRKFTLLLSDLIHKMDPASPEFLDTTLKFLEPKDSQTSITRFVSLVIGLLDEKDVLHKVLVSLLTSFIKVPTMHNRISLRIKDLFMDARYLKDKDRRNHKCVFAVLLAKTWSLKAEIFATSTGTLLTSDIEDFCRALIEGSRYLDSIFTPAQGKEENQILKLVGQLSKKVSLICTNKLFLANVMNELHKFLVKMILFKAMALLSEILGSNVSLLLPVKRQMGTLRWGLFILKEFVIHDIKKNTQVEKLILTDIEVVASGVISLCNKNPSDRATEAAVKIMDGGLSDLLEKFQHLTAKLRGFCIPMPNFPRTPGLCFIELLLQNLRNLLSRTHDSEAYSTHQFEAICRDLESIISSFGDVSEQGVEEQECNNLHTRLVDAAYQAEHAIDLTVDGNEPVWQHHLWLYDLSKEVRNIKMQLEDSYEKNTSDDGLRYVPQRSIPFASQVTTASIEEVMEGLSDQKEVIIGRLNRGTLRRDIVSIVGLPGIGKTTLAKNLFCSPSVMYHFSIRAWCCVSQAYKKRDLLLDILSHIIMVTDEIHEKTDYELDSMLYKKLKGNRYLIVMDDIWSTGVWDDLQLSFPDDSNGSRILFTSRLHDVVSNFSDPHPLRPLSEEESWELLKMKIFREEGCPEELLEVGQQIAENCKGLPLAIIAIAGLLDKTNRKQDSWKQIAESVSSRVVNDPETRCKEILELSYKHLPDRLKACFLYFGAFPDKEIPVQRLQWLWIAEGFVRKLESKSRSLEDLAEDYFMELVGRSLVTVAKRGSNGKAKTCRLHDVIRDFCLLKAKEDKFLQLISGNDEPYSSFDSLDYGEYYDLITPPDSIIYEEYRLCFCVNSGQFVVSRPCGPFVRSLLFYATTVVSPKRPFDVSFIRHNFKRLRVLDLESINMGNSFENGIELLIGLRYLAVCGDMESIPSSLSNLENLETLLVKGPESKVTLPDSLWRMKNLRHVHVTNRAIFTFQNDKNGRSSELVDLVTLSLPSFSYGKETNDIIMRFPNLRKLKCMFVKPKDVSMNFCQCPALESLSQLESLKMSYFGDVLNTGEMNLPSSLKKLTISNFRFPWNHMSAIGRLQMLEVLKLVSRAFEGSRWDMTEGETFLKLKYLELNSLNIEHWVASSDHLPVLEQLVLKNCKKLEEVPYDLIFISTLQKIEVQQCGISVEKSVRKIEEQEIEGLKIVINNWRCSA